MSSEQTFRFQMKVLRYLRRRKGKLVTVQKVHYAMRFRVPIPLSKTQRAINALMKRKLVARAAVLSSDGNYAYRAVTIAAI